MTGSRTDFWFNHILTPVYGPENVTSGAVSDIRNATSTASAMVRVRMKTKI